MVTGCQRKIFYVKDTKSRVFSEAYFILRGSADFAVSDCDLAAEADRILREKMPRRRHRRAFAKAALFCAGAAAGAVICAAIFLII